MGAGRALRLPRLTASSWSRQIRLYFLESFAPSSIRQLQQLVGDLIAQDLAVQAGLIDNHEISGVNLRDQNDHCGEPIDIACVKDELVAVIILHKPAQAIAELRSEEH